MKSKTAELINWVLHIPLESLQNQIRVGKWAAQTYQDDPVVSFLMSKCTEDFSEKGFLSMTLLYEALDDYFRENGLPPLTGTLRKRVFNLIVDWLTGTFGIPPVQSAPLS